MNEVKMRCLSSRTVFGNTNIHEVLQLYEADGGGRNRVAGGGWVAEWQNGGMVEWQNGGMVGWWDGRIDIPGLPGCALQRRVNGDEGLWTCSYISGHGIYRCRHPGDGLG